MRKLFAGTRMIFVCIVITLYLVIVGIPVLTYCRLVSKPAIALRLSKLLDRIVLFLGGITYNVEGADRLDPNRGYIFVANHRSFSDVAVVFVAAPGDCRFLGKKELFQIPLVGFALRTMGMIEVDRSDHDAATKSIDLAAAHLASGKSIILFPEGTRNRDKGVLPFKKGAFVLAIQAQVPVVPITVIGAEKAIRPDTIFLYPAHLRVLIHDPINTTGLTIEDRNTLLEQARSVIEKAYLEGTASSA